MKKERKKKKKAIEKQNKEEEENEENEELQYSFKEENVSIDQQIQKYKIIIRILITIIIILIICVAYQIFSDKSNTKEKTRENIVKENNKNNDENSKEEENKEKEENKNIVPVNTLPPGEKRKIYVKYMDFWPAFRLERFDVHRILLERYEVIQSEKPDYVIFGEFGGQNYDIENRINCVKLFLSIENRDPNFANTDYAIGIHYINKGDRYFRKPTEVHQLTAIHSVYNVTKVKGIDIKTKKFCAWVVSNGGGTVRNKFFDKLSEYKTVDSGGSYKNNVGGAVSDKLGFLKNQKID